MGPILGTRAIKTKKEKAQMEEIISEDEEEKGKGKEKKKRKKEERGERRMDLRGRKKGKWTNLIGCWSGNKQEKGVWDGN